MIREIDAVTICATFLDLMAEIEAGPFYKKDNPRHVQWLTSKVNAHRARGARFHAMYDDSDMPLGFYALLLEEAVEGIPWLGRRAELLDIAVYPAFRKRGYGRQLLRHAEDTAAAHGAACVDLSATTFNSSVLHFYISNGYLPRVISAESQGPHTWTDIWFRKTL